MSNQRVAIGGFQHETNTFPPMLATFEDFVEHDAWPGLTRGSEMMTAVAGKNIPITGFIEACGTHYELIPLLWGSAEPSSYVTNHAFDTVSGMMMETLREAGPLDAVYLDLHGAMVVQDHEDGEGELVRRVRQVVGDDLPVIVSLDFHANITEALSRLATGLTIFRTYPHLDMAHTGARAFRLLDHVLKHGALARAFRRVPFLLPLTSQCTNFEPNASLYASLPAREADAAAFLSIDFAEGFPPADIEECGPSIVAYAPSEDEAHAAADKLWEAVMAAEPDFTNPLLGEDEAVREAMSVTAERPVVLADVQDNPGAGGASDTVGLLRAMVRNGVTGAVMAILDDAQTARRSHELGVGARFGVALGGKSGQPGQTPYKCDVLVEALGDGKFLCTGEMYRGTHTDLGPMALLRIEDEDADVRVIVGGKRFQCLDLAIFRHLGVEPTEQRLLAVKSTAHFRADFDPIAHQTLLVESPGAHPCRLVGLAYQRLRKGVRLEAMGPAFSGPAAAGELDRA